MYAFVRAVASAFLAAMFLASLSTPALATGGPSPNSEAEITFGFDATCNRVRVSATKLDGSSPKTLSYVEITYTDGTTERFTDLTRSRFGTSSETPIESVEAKSGTTIASAICGA